MAGDEALRCVAQVLSEVPDPRKRRGVRHPFGAILSLVFVGLVVRITEMATLVRWAKEYWPELKDSLGFTRDEPPCDTTISRALAGLTVETFQKAFRKLVQKFLALENEPLVAAVDGKACRQGKEEDDSPVVMLNVFVQKLKLTIQQWQLKGGKTNEATALREHVRELVREYPLLMLLTGDAIFAQRPLLEVLQKEGLDYLFQVKGNQPELLEALQACFADAESRPPDARRTEKKGGARKTYRLWVNEADAVYAREKLGIAGCQMVIRVDYEGKKGDKVERQTRYYITSLDPEKVSPEKLLEWIRRHWEIENSLHFVKDRWWDEDRHWLKRPGLAAIWAMLTNLALNVLRVMGRTVFPSPNPKRPLPLRAIADKAGWHLRTTLTALGFCPN